MLSVGFLHFFCGLFCVKNLLRSKLKNSAQKCTGIHHFYLKVKNFLGGVQSLPKTLPDGEGTNHLPITLCIWSPPCGHSTGPLRLKTGNCIQKVCPHWNVIAPMQCWLATCLEERLANDRISMLVTADTIRCHGSVRDRYYCKFHRPTGRTTGQPGRWCVR